MPQLEFAGISTGLAALIGFFSGLDLETGNLIGAKLGSLSAALWMVLAVHFFRRYRLRKEQRLGMLAPCLGIVASITAFVWFFLSVVCA